MSSTFYRNHSRRALLAGLSSLGFAIPILSGRPAAAAPPRRFLVLFSPNGTILNAWRPTGTGGTDFTFSRILKPLEPFRSQLLILDGIFHQSALSGPGDDHMKGMGHWLTGTELLPGTMASSTAVAGAGLAGGPSIDQVIAEKIGADTKFRSLEFGMFNEISGQWAVMTRMIYSAANQPLPPVDVPDTMFGRLFAGSNVASPGDTEARTRELQRLRLLRKSVLDFVSKDLATLEKQVGADDRLRIQQHAASLRDAEKRLIPDPASAAACTPPGAPPKINTRDHAQHRTVSRLQSDMIAMAFSCGLTNVASMQWNRASGGAQFPDLGINTGHHDISHLGDSDAVAVEQLTKINVWYAEEVAYLLGKLASTKEPDGSSVLDNTLVMWGNELCIGNTHSHQPAVPTVLAGGKNFTGLTMGRHVQLTGKLRSNNDLYVNFLNIFGVPNPSGKFGNPRFCRGAIPELI